MITINKEQYGSEYTLKKMYFKKQQSFNFKRFVFPITL